MRDLSTTELKALREAIEAYPVARLVAPELQGKLEAELEQRGLKFVVRAFETSWKTIDKKK